MIRTYTSAVNSRILKSGRTRFRFRLNAHSMEVVHHAIRLTKFKYSNSAIDAICLSYLGGNRPPTGANYLVHGSERFLVKLFPDEYEIVRLALDSVREVATSDAEALIVICETFIAFEGMGK